MKRFKVVGLNHLVILLAGLTLVGCRAPDQDQLKGTDQDQSKVITERQQNLRRQVADAELICINGIQYMDGGKTDYNIVPLFNQLGPVPCSGGVKKGTTSDSAIITIQKQKVDK